MKRRHWASEEEATSDLASAAASAALVHAGLRAQRDRLFHRRDRDSGLLFSRDRLSRRVASWASTEKPAFDIAIACSGFIYGLTVASGLIRSGVYERIMLIGAETLSKILDKNDRSTAILFGDGAGAVILERSAEDSFLASELGADGSRPELLYAQGSGARQPDRSRRARREGAPHSHARPRNVQARGHREWSIDRLGAGEGEPHAKPT